jgi:iron complex transport system substrate-binding protein
MQLLGLLFIVLMLVTAPLLATDKPQRIVSIGLCTDQLLLMLAEREQIASVSVQPWRKYYAEFMTVFI